MMCSFAKFMRKGLLLLSVVALYLTRVLLRELWTNLNFLSGYYNAVCVGILIRH